MYVPLMASVGVLKPSPTSLYHLFSFVAIFFPPARIQDSACSEECESAIRTTGLGVLEDVLFLICLLDLKLELGTDPIMSYLRLAHLCVSHRVVIEVVRYGEWLSEVVVTCLDSAEATATETIQYNRQRPKKADWMASRVSYHQFTTRDAMCAHVYHTRPSETNGPPTNPRYSLCPHATPELTVNLGKFFVMSPNAKPAPPQQASLTELWKRPKSTVKAKGTNDTVKKDPNSMGIDDAASGLYN